MPVKIRLRRVGAKHQPSYRIVVADSRSPRSGRYLDQVGFYNPLTNPATITVNTDKAVDWLRRGAQPTDTVLKLLSKFNIEPAAVRKGESPAPVDRPAAPRQTRPAARTAPSAPETSAASATTEAPTPEPADDEVTVELAPDEAPVVPEGSE